MDCKIELSSKQILFMRSKKRGIIYRGGIRSGKSRVACYKAILNALQGRTQLMVSFTYKNLKDVILETLKQCIPLFGLEPKDYDINLGDMIVYIKGTKILLRSGDSPDKIRGIEVADVFIDESREFKNKEIFLICIGRMSERNDGQWHITSSPKGKDWTYELKEQDVDNEIELIVQKTTENPFLPENYVEMVRKNYTTQFAQQELDAEIIEFGTGIIKPSWFNKVDFIFNEDRRHNAVRFWDTAVTTKTSSDFSAGALCKYENDVFTICHMAHGKWDYPTLKKKIIEFAKQDGYNVTIGIEVVGQTRAFLDDLRQEPELLQYTIKGTSPWSDKLNRALPWISRAETGKVNLARGGWNKELEDEFLNFTGDDSHEHDDQIDAISGAYYILTRQIEVTTAKIRY